MTTIVSVANYVAYHLAEKLFDQYEDSNRIERSVPVMVMNRQKRLLLQEVFHVYLNKFEDVVTHSFLAILGSN